MREWDLAQAEIQALGGAGIRRTQGSERDLELVAQVQEEASSSAKSQSSQLRPSWGTCRSRERAGQELLKRLPWIFKR